MPKMQEIRARAHNRAERWEHRLEALEARLQDTGAEAARRVEDTALALAEAAEALEHKLEPAAEELRRSLQELRVQMALGKAETREAFDAQSSRIHKQLHSAEHLLDQLGDRLETLADKETERFVRVGDRLRSELEAAELQFTLGRADARDALEENRGRLRSWIAEARKELKAAGEDVGEHWQAIEDRLSKALAELRASFRSQAGR